jgi:hypothetical protein
MKRALHHNHIVQSKEPVAGCPACSSINAEHMSRGYIFTARAQARVERALRE